MRLLLFLSFVLILNSCKKDKILKVYICNNAFTVYDYFGGDTTKSQGVRTNIKFSIEEIYHKNLYNLYFGNDLSNPRLLKWLPNDFFYADTYGTAPLDTKTYLNGKFKDSFKSMNLYINRVSSLSKTITFDTCDCNLI